jgi:hypothetical protein
VHEFGVWPSSESTAAAAGFLPTLAFQDGTLEHAREAIERRLAEIAAAV